MFVLNQPRRHLTNQGVWFFSRVKFLLGLCIYPVEVQGTLDTRTKSKSWGTRRANAGPDSFWASFQTSKEMKREKQQLKKSAKQWTEQISYHHITQSSASKQNVKNWHLKPKQEVSNETINNNGSKRTRWKNTRSRRLVASNREVK